MPSESQRDTLRNYLEYLEDMVYQRVSSKATLFPFDPGYGKTLSTACMIKTLLDTPDLEYVGVLYVAERREELNQVFKQINRPNDVGILTTDSGGYEYPENCTYMGSRATRARVLLTTKKMVQKRITLDGENAFGILNYKSQPRLLRVWDEEFLPAEGITIPRHSLQSLAGQLKRRSNSLYQAVDTLIDDMKVVNNGDLLTLPDFRSHHPLNDILGWLEDHQDLQSVMSNLWQLSESIVRVTRNTYNGDTLYSHVELFPKSLLPLAVLDASGRFRHMYRTQAQHRGNVCLDVVNQYEPKQYDDLIIRLARRSGAKSTWEKVDEAEFLAEECAKAIAADKGRRWLVIHHKDVDLKQRILEAAPDLECITIKYLTFGQHTATNDFSNCNGVIIAGTLHYPVPAYYALDSAARDLKSTDAELDKGGLQVLKQTEVQHHLFQALCRGTVRKTINGRCGEMLAHIIASPRSGITKDSLQAMFPGCRVEPWVLDNPADKLKGKAKIVYETVREWASKAKPGDTLRFTKVYTWNRKKFHENVRGNYYFKLALEAIGVREDDSGRYRTRWIKTTSA